MDLPNCRKACIFLFCYLLMTARHWTLESWSMVPPHPGQNAHPPLPALLRNSPRPARHYVPAQLRCGVLFEWSTGRQVLEGGSSQCGSSAGLCSPGPSCFRRVLGICEFTSIRGTVCRQWTRPGDSVAGDSGYYGQLVREGTQRQGVWLVEHEHISGQYHRCTVRRDTNKSARYLGTHYANCHIWLAPITSPIHCLGQ